MLAAATFSPDSSPALIRKPLVNATLVPECMPANFSDCGRCWSNAHPLLNDTALSGAVAWVDLTAVTANVTICYTYGYQFALLAQSAGAVALLVRALPNAFAPRSKYLQAKPLNIPTFSTEYDQSQLMKQGVSNGTAVVTLPALAGGVGPAFYPATMSDLPLSQLSVYVNRSAVAAFTCPLGQSLFQPAVWPGAPAPASNGSFAGVHYFVEGVPKPECNVSDTCAACILGGVNQLVRPRPLSAFFALQLTAPAAHPARAGHHARRLLILRVRRGRQLPLHHQLLADHRRGGVSGRLLSGRRPRQPERLGAPHRSSNVHSRRTHAARCGMS